MSEEQQYLQRIKKHNAWHRQQKEEPTIDLSCERCYPIEEEDLPSRFKFFWHYWVTPRGQGTTYTSHTYNQFQQVENQPENREELLRPLPLTIRYRNLLPPVDFQTLSTQLASFWEFTTLAAQRESAYHNTARKQPKSDSDTSSTTSTIMSDKDDNSQEQ